MSHSIRIGTILKSNREIMGNDKGSLAVCYEIYMLGDRMGYSFIFPNGRYDGFSPSETEEFFEDDFAEYAGSVGNYHFMNVIKLSRDYENGVFDNAFEYEKINGYI